MNTTKPVNFSMTGESVTVFLSGRGQTFYQGSSQYAALTQAIAQATARGERLSEEEARVLVEPMGLLTKYLYGTEFLVSETGKVTYKGYELPKSIEDRLNAMARAGENVTPMLRFFERLDRNPSMSSREQLFDFMQHNNIAIEPDGTLLCYKGVRDDYLDCHSGTISNLPGSVVTMPRNQISDDRTKQCHQGLHVGARGYAVGDDFGNGGFGSTHIVVRVDPEHVVCVPLDYNAQKMRVCQYEVIGDFNESTDLTPDDASELSEPDEPSSEECADCGGDGYHWNAEEEDDEFVCSTCGGSGVVDVEEDDGVTPSIDAIPHGNPVAAFSESLEDATKAAGVTITRKTLRGMDKLRTTLELMEQPIAKLRKYAKKLKIVGATKIAGGKSALVAKIMQVRKNRDAGLA